MSNTVNNKSIPFYRSGDTMFFMDNREGVDEEYMVREDHNLFKEILLAIADNDIEKAVSMFNQSAVKAYIRDMTIGKIKFENGVMTYDDLPVSDAIASKVAECYQRGIDYTGYLNFARRLMENTSHRVREELTSFVDIGLFSVTETGTFLAYKVVNADYTDCHTATVDNSVGKIVEMPKSEVDDDKHNLCSYGYHVCSKGYIPHFMQTGRRLMLVEVAPEHVVSIPTDYNNSKMRVYKYTVVAELDENFEERDIAPVMQKLPIRNEKGHFTGKYVLVEVPATVPTLDMRSANEALRNRVNKENLYYGDDYDDEDEDDYWYEDDEEEYENY